MSPAEWENPWKTGPRWQIVSNSIEIKHMRELTEKAISNGFPIQKIPERKKVSARMLDLRDQLNRW